jgi:hypothetical protein
MEIHNYLQLLAIAIWMLTHLLIHAAPVILPGAIGLAALRSLLHRPHPARQPALQLVPVKRRRV